MRPRHIAMLISLALPSGCNGQADVQIGFGLSVPDDPGPKPGLTIESAEMMVRDLVLGGNHGKPDMHRKVFQTIDLLDPASSDLNLLDIEPGLYHRLTLRVRATEDAPIFVAGLVDGVPFELRDASRFTVTLLSDAGIPVEEGHVAELFVEFDVEAWFADVDLAALVVSPDGIIYIDAGHNVKAYETIHAAIAASIDLVDDRH